MYSSDNHKRLQCTDQCDHALMRLTAAPNVLGTPPIFHHLYDQVIDWPLFYIAMALPLFYCNVYATFGTTSVVVQTVLYPTQHASQCLCRSKANPLY